MKEIILSHDSEAYLYSVPDEVARSLRKYVTKFDTRMQNGDLPKEYRSYPKFNF